MKEQGAELAGLRVLVVEDEALIAMMLEEMLLDFGCTTIGPCATVDEALDACASKDFDMALIDMNLGGLSAEPVVDHMAARGIPCAIATGGDFQPASGFVRLHKPYGQEQLWAAMIELKDRL